MCGGGGGGGDGGGGGGGVVGTVEQRRDTEKESVHARLQVCVAGGELVRVVASRIEGIGEYGK